MSRGGSLDRARSPPRDHGTETKEPKEKLRTGECKNLVNQ